MEIGIIINDPIHGPMEFDPLLQSIIDTPQFQRLRDIKQLGGSNYVYPAAEHSRFTHSLGVSHLARNLVLSLHKNSPHGQVISDLDVLCVSIAGLVHDLGHGAFSHLWENFLSRQRPKDEWCHEEQSFKMLRHLIDENHLWPQFVERGFSDIDLTFIEELIKPPKYDDDALCSKTYPFEGRKPGKEFLYQIVSNPVSGIDVDKFDYIARDSKLLGVDVTYDFRRFELMARILEQEDSFWFPGTDQRRKKLYIGTRDKEAYNMASMFKTRQDLHRKAYQHKTTKIAESLMLDVLCLVDDVDILPIYGDDGRRYSLSEAHVDPSAYQHIDNRITWAIQNLRVQQLPQQKQSHAEKAKQKLKDLQCRKLPKCVHVINFNPSLYEDWLKLDKQKWLPDLLWHHHGNEDLQPEDIDLVLTQFDFGAKGQDPIEKVRFYTKDGATIKKSMKTISNTLPVHLAEQQIFVYAVQPQKQDAVRKAAVRWEEAKKTEWATPKRLRPSNIRARDGDDVGSGDHAMGGDRDGDVTYIEPGTPPSSQESRVSLRLEEEEATRVSGGQRRETVKRQIFREEDRDATSLAENITMI